MQVGLSNWKISQTGLVLALLPLAFSFGFLCVLSYLLYQSQAQTSRAERAREVQSIANSLGRCYFQAVSTVSSYMFLSHDKMHAERLGELQKENSRLSARLRELVVGDRQLTTVANEFCDAEDEAFEMLGTFAEVARDGDSSPFLRIDGIKTEAGSISNRVVLRLAQITTILHQRQERERLETGRLNWGSLLERFVYFGFVLSIAATYATQRLFGKEIANRLEVVVSNTHRLTRKEPLLPPLTGADEIASLDKTFHRMVDVLCEAERTKREFVAMLTHDLRNPLTAINLALDSLAYKHPDLAEEDRLLSNSRRSVTRLLQMINDLLDLERLDNGKMPLDKEIVSMSEILQRAVDSVQPLAEDRRVCIEQSVHADDEAFADGERLVRVVINLLANAIRYSPADEVVSLMCARTPDSFRISVVDRGPGIPADKQSVLFQKYCQVEPADSRKGTGLGLAICKAIVESHNGQIGVESESGTGTTFWFSIPRPVD